MPNSKRPECTSHSILPSLLSVMPSLWRCLCLCCVCSLDGVWALPYTTPSTQYVQDPVAPNPPLLVSQMSRVHHTCTEEKILTQATILFPVNKLTTGALWLQALRSFRLFLSYSFLFEFPPPHPTCVVRHTYPFCPVKLMLRRLLKKISNRCVNAYSVATDTNTTSRR